MFIRMSFAILWLFSSAIYAKEQTVKIVDSAGKGHPNVVIYFEPKQASTTISDIAPAIMDQIDTQFVPHILAVQKNSMVQFPNSDSIKHHVYSFSAAKTFELQLYKDFKADPLLFANEGVVELGCNVHDWMLGYIFVVDTPYFGKTNAKGEWVIDLPEGDYSLKVWSPLIQDNLESLTKEVSISETSSTLVINLAKPMLQNLHQYEQVDEFSDYE